MNEAEAIIAAIWAQRRNQVLIVGGLLLLILVAWAGQSWIVEPRLKDLQSEQLRLQQQVRQRQLQEARSGVPVSTVEQINSNLQRFNALIPDIKEFSSFVGELFTLAEEANLDIAQVNYKPEHDPYSELVLYGVSFSVDGSYAELKKFIHLLENSSRIILIDNIALSDKSDKSDKQEKVSLQIKLRSYFREDSA